MAGDQSRTNPLCLGVVVPVYNRAKTVLATLESIAQQSVLPRRLVVVDDGSRDGSADSAERWIAEHRPACDTRVIRQPNGGAASARNRGLAELADCDWVAFLDSDDRWPADFLARATAAIAARPDAVAASADRLFVEAATGETQAYHLADLAASPALWMLSHGAALASCSVFSANRVRELGGFPTDIQAGEDSALLLPLSLRGAWLHLPGAPVTFQRFTQKTVGEEAAFSRKYQDNHRLWARVYDQFFRGLSRQKWRAIAPPRTICRLLAKRWLLAGEELAEHGQMHAAARCYARAIGWRWTKWENWQLFAQTEWSALTTRRQAA